MTGASGIRKILPGSEISDFEFDPCGYSLNGIEGSAISTIHVIPEDGFSYASFKAAGYDMDAVYPHQLIDRVLNCFQPEEFSIAVRMDAAASGALQCGGPLDLSGYLCGERCYQTLVKGGFLAYQSFKMEKCESPKSILKCWPKEESEEE